MASERDAVTSSPAAVALAARAEPSESAGVANESADGGIPTAEVCGEAGAAMLAALMPHLAELDRASVIQFYRLLSHHLGFDGNLTCRPAEERLGLLITLVGSGELPPVSRYEDARRAERKAGRNWLTASALGESFGGYPRAVEAAVRYLSPGSSPGPRGRSSAPRGRYSREEILASVRGCRSALLSPDRSDPDWYPDSETFFLWNRIGREAARKAGRPDPRLPDRETFKRWFVSYEEAVEGCRREERLRALAPARLGARPRPRRPRSRRVGV